MRKVCYIFISCFLTHVAFAQNVAYVNGKPISAKEFMWVYKKNHPGTTNANYKDLAEYLALYLNFKLKVAEAKAIGLDTDTAYKKEINGYENALKAQRNISPKNSQYTFIMNEYREGVLMFTISEQKIWNKAQENETQLINFYTKNKSLYRNKEFNEARGQVIADYQQYLEDQWIKELKTKYTVKINDDELKKLAKP